jgi:hypothetical protein
VLGLAGARFLTTHAIVDVFAATRMGFLRFAEANSAICIAIFPPPIACRLAAGYTALAFNVGGGASVAVARQGRLRTDIEVGDLMVGYNFDAIRPGGETTDGFLSHNLLLTLGLRWRF